MKLRRGICCLLLAGFLVVSFVRQGAAISGPSGFVNDRAGVLSNTARASMGALLEDVERKTGVEFAIVTVRSTRPDTIEGYAVKLFESWGIGKKGEDNGILVLVASDDRKVRIEVGYGLEGTVTDLISSRIIQEYMLPEFRKGDYDSGVSAAVLALTGIIGELYGVTFDGSTVRGYYSGGKGRRGSPLGSLFTLLFFIMVFGLRFGSLFFLMSGGGGYWSGGGGHRGSYGGGFGGFGGGLSGGGGASGSW